jgi:hypothetical protein
MLHVTEINNNVLDITSFSLALLHLLRGFSWFRCMPWISFSAVCSKVTSEVWSYKGFFGGVDQRSWKEGDCSLLSSLFLSIHTHPTLMSNYMSENQHRPYYLMSPVNFLGVQCISTWLGSPHPSCLGHQPSLQNVQLGFHFVPFLVLYWYPKR